ncbi:uncharacterized protein LOC134816524 isoform X1 [Bolinopsis microptera]|uniref:uncharacterized protein LOC134816524 isoform X1 n=1 Tax=Bolinopsis microptera TaxID=2820187 RepID=UPI00307AA97B
MMYRQKLSKVKCGRCQLVIPLRLWREHTLQHGSLRILKLDNYPPSFLELTRHYCSMLEKIDDADKKSTARLTNAYDTLKMLYFKDFKEYSEDNCYSPGYSPSFEKMTEALAPKNYNYASWDCESNTDPPAPYSFGLKIEQLNENIFHSEELIQELRQTFFTADPVTPDLRQDDGSLWGCAMFEGLKGNTASRYTASNYWSYVKEILGGGSSFPSPHDIRRAMKRSLHKIDVNLKQGHEELGQSRWSGVTGCMCIFQTIPSQDNGQSRPSTATSQTETSTDNVKDSLGMLHVANIGSVTAILSREGLPKKITYTHTAADKAERERVISNGAAVSSSGQVNCVTTVTRALGFHGDVSLRHALSQKSYCNSVPLFESDEFLIIANATFWKYLGPTEACNMCKSLLAPSLRKLIHIFTTLPNEVQEEALSNASTLDYDALVSDFGDNSQDSSMIPDNESEKNVMLVKFNSLIKMATCMLAKKFTEANEDKADGVEAGAGKSRQSGYRSKLEGRISEEIEDDESQAGDEINWSDMFNDPIDNLSVDDVCKMLSDTMSDSLVDAARQAGAVGPISCGVMLLQGALESVRRRLFYEQAIHELKKMFDDFAMSEASLMSSSAGDAVSVLSTSSGVNLLPPSFEALDQYEPSLQSPTDMVSHQISTIVGKPPSIIQPDIAEHMTLDPGSLVFKDSLGVLKLTRNIEKLKYKNLNLDALRLEDVDDASLTKQEQRDMIRDMVAMAIHQNTTPDPEAEGDSAQPITPTATVLPTAVS